MKYRVLVINPGSTSTKIAVFQGADQIFKKTIEHSRESLAGFQKNSDQLDYRKKMILDALQEENIKLDDMDAFAARGGALVEHPGGIFPVNALMVRHAHDELKASHPAALAVQIADAFTKLTGKPSYMVNSPSTDEMKQVARITGLKGVYRKCYTHALNQKEIGMRYAESIGRAYEELNLIICHIGGGISITAHEKGLMIDTNDIIDGDGPMTPTRCGTIPVSDIVELCFQSRDKAELTKRFQAKGGLYDHLGSFDAKEISARINNGDSYAKNIYDAMIYQIAKYIGSMHVALRCETDAIVLTGGIANDRYVTDGIAAYVDKIAPVHVIPGEFEMEALNHGAQIALAGGKTREYTGVPTWDESELYRHS